MTDLFGEPTQPIPDKDSAQTHKQQLADSQAAASRLKSVLAADGCGSRRRFTRNETGKGRLPKAQKADGVRWKSVH